MKNPERNQVSCKLFCLLFLIILSCKSEMSNNFSSPKPILFCQTLKADQELNISFMFACF